MEDIKLLKILENNARYSITDLAVVLNESESSVENSLENLQKEKVVCGFHTVINWDKTNLDHVMAMIEVSSTPERDKGYDKVARAIYSYPEVTTMYLMSGKSEFIVIINGKTMREVADFVGQKLAPIEGVKATVTHFVLKRYKVEGVVLEEEESSQGRLLMTP